MIAMASNSATGTNGRAIPGWTDCEGRVWLDTGLLHRESGEIVIELLNGQVRGVKSWVEQEFGPLEQIGVVRE